MIGLLLISLLTVVACIGSFRYPLLGLGTYVSFAVLRPHFIFGWAGDLSGISQWVGLAALAGWLFARFGNWRLGRARAGTVLLALFAGWSVLSSFTAIYPNFAFASLENLAKFAVPVVMGVTLLDSSVDRRRVFWIMVLAQGYVGFEMNLNYAVKGFNQAAEGFGGMDNNCFGAALAAMLGPAIALVITSRTWYERAAAAASGLLILHTALLTFSRGTMVGLLAVGAVAFVMMPKRPKYLAALLVAGLIAARLTGPQLLARYGSAFVGAEERDGSAQSRVDLWRDCLRVISDYPVLGVGPANWRPIASQYGWSQGKSAHSVWMETAAETGIPGATFLLLFFLVPASRLWRIARERLTDDNRDDVAIAMGVVLSATGFVVSAQFVSVQGLETPYYVIMTGLAVLKARSVVAPNAVAAPSLPVVTSGLAVAVPSPRIDVGRAPAVGPAVKSGPRILDLGPSRRPRRT